MGPSFDYFTYSAEMSLAEGCLGEYRPLSSCFHLRIPAFVSPPISHLVQELSSVRFDSLYQSISGSPSGGILSLGAG